MDLRLISILFFTSCSFVGGLKVDRHPAGIEDLSCQKSFLSIVNSKDRSVEKLLRTQYLLRKKDATKEAFYRDKKAIASAYELSPEGAPIVNFAKNLDRLISDLSPKEKTIIWENLNNIKHNKKPLINGNASFNYRTKLTMIELPEAYHGTDLDYFLRLHESFHLITQVVLEERLPDQVRRGVFIVGQNIRREYLEEMGAMAQEWFYVASMPKLKRAELKKIVTEDSELNKTFKNIILSALETADKGPQSHVFNQHLAKRYDPKSIKFDTLIRRDLRLMTSGAGLVSGFLVWTVKCLPDGPEGELKEFNICDYYPF